VTSAPSRHAPLFIVFEGTDGSGTTTQGDLLAAALRQAGRTVLRTAEPSDGPVGRQLRQVLREKGAERLDPSAVALLFAADRVDHCERVIGPALQRGDVVVCDRYLGSSLAFQVVDGQGKIDAPWVLAINRAALVPDLSILLDVPVGVALTRIHKRGKPQERFEIEETLTGVRLRYVQLFQEAPTPLGRCVRIDAHRAREAVAYDVLGAVMQGLALAEALLRQEP
jgi:dTMP kinase